MLLFLVYTKRLWIICTFCNDSCIGFNEATRRYLANGRSLAELKTSELLVAGGVGGLLYWTTTYPLDVVKVKNLFCLI